MKKIIYLIIILSAGFSFGCKKEDRILKKLVGVWTIKEYTRAGGYIKNDFSSDVTTIEFISHKKAYTSTLRAIYKVDYADPSKTDMVDTLRYELKSDELDISYVQKSANIKFLRNRFKLKEYKNSKLQLNRIDSTDLYIKAIK